MRCWLFQKPSLRTLLVMILTAVQRSEKRIMATITDVNAALDQLSTSLTTQLTAIQTEIQQLANAGGSDPAALQAIADRIGALNTSVGDTIVALASDDPPPAPIAPAGSAASVP